VVKAIECDMSYLEFYYKYAEPGILPKHGLCSCFGEQAMILFNPDDFMPWDYWAYSGARGSLTTDLIVLRDKIGLTFCPLRQNIVLLMAAMSGEL
jgi:hypothetical protein